MYCIKKSCVCFVVLLMFIIIFNSHVQVNCEENSNPLKFGEFSVLKEIPVFKDFEITSNDKCSGHTQFEQVSARSDGSFVIYSKFIAEKGVPEDTFKRKYIDIYDTSGAFVKELCFTIPYNFAIEFTDKTINFYFTDSIMIYELETAIIKRYSIEQTVENSNKVYDKQNNKNFVCGEWEYKYHKNILGECVKLTRTNGEIEQTLVNMSGTIHKIPWSGIIIAVLILIVLLVIKYRRHRDGSAVSFQKHK